MATHIDEAEISRGLRAGRQEAWTALYEAYSSRIWRFVSRIVGPGPSSVADIVQETFLAAATSARSYDASRGSLWNWLSGIAYHQTLAHWRRLRQAARLAESAAAGDQPLGSSRGTALNPAAATQQQERAEQVRSTLAELPHDYVALLVSKYLDGLSLNELAVEFGLSFEAVRSKLARARREFRTRFGAFDGD